MIFVCVCVRAYMCICLCVHVCVCGHTSAMVHMPRSGNSFGERLPFYLLKVDCRVSVAGPCIPGRQPADIRLPSPVTFISKEDWGDQQCESYLGFYAGSRD